RRGRVARSPTAPLLAASVTATVQAPTSFPMVTHAAPTAVQRGTSADVTVECRTSTLYGAYKVLVEGEGVTVEIVPVKDAKPADPKGPPPVVTAIKLKVTVAIDAAPGVREFRIATSPGISSLGQRMIA